MFYMWCPERGRKCWSFEKHPNHRTPCLFSKRKQRLQRQIAVTVLHFRALNQNKFRSNLSVFCSQKNSIKRASIFFFLNLKLPLGRQCKVLSHFHVSKRKACSKINLSVSRVFDQEAREYILFVCYSRARHVNWEFLKILPIFRSIYTMIWKNNQPWHRLITFLSHYSISTRIQTLVTSTNPKRKNWTSDCI